MLSALDNRRVLYLSILNFVGFYKDGYLYLLVFEEGNSLYWSPLFVAHNRHYYFDIDTHSRHVCVTRRGKCIDSQAFFCRLATYALSAGELNMRLNRGDCSVTFIGRGGMSLPQLRSHFDDIVSPMSSIWRLVALIIVDGIRCI